MSVKKFDVNPAIYEDGVNELGHSWRNARMSMTYYYIPNTKRTLDVTLQARRERCGNGVVNHIFTYCGIVCMFNDNGFPVIGDKQYYMGPSARELVSEMPFIDELLSDPKALINILNEIDVFKKDTSTKITDAEKLSWTMAQFGAMLGNMVAEAAKQRDMTNQDSTETIVLQAYVFASAAPVQVDDESDVEPLVPKPAEQPDELACTDAAESVAADETDAE